MRLGIDTGGTFTDFVAAHDDGRVEVFKLRSNPADPARVILDGLSRIAHEGEVVHGSTVATNALLERKGARTALLTTVGFEDVIRIGRQNRRQLYVLNPPLPVPLVSPSLCFGVHERTYFDGTVAKKPRTRDLVAKLKRARVESVAICFLHSYRNAENERAVAEALAQFPHISVSHEICPEFREYERTSTTVLNAYVQPLMERYLRRLEATGDFAIMQSNGGLMSVGEARQFAVRTLLSGPAGGVVGAVEVARLSGFNKILSFDMGGTSTDVSLSQGTPRQSTEAYVDGFPVRVPMLDIHTVGAGGGSIARVDEGGLLRVGPESAGAEPGPACYGRGTVATVTDAHVVLERIRAEHFLGGTMVLHPQRAAAVIDALAAKLGVSREKAALGVVRVANANMERAIRTVSLERGYDPRDFALVAFGGCGGLHACEIAENLGIRAVVVPEHAGVLSALGMLMADRVRDYAAGVLGRTGIERQYQRLEKRARKDMRGAKLDRFADVRYTGQSYELTIPVNASFHDEHARVYGYADPSRPTELVTVRVRATLPVPSIQLQSLRRKVEPARGSACIADYGSTTYVPKGWKIRVDKIGSLILTRR